MMSSKQAAQGTFDRHHAIVIGGSIAGLLAARVLSDHFEQVTMIERDRLTGNTDPRKGVPQGRHVHVLLAREAVLMREYFPDLFRNLAQDGAIPVRLEDVHWNQLGVWMAPVPSPVKALFQTRPFLEQHVREQLAARANVRIIDVCEVSELCVYNDRITGVVLRYRTGEQREEELSADLVVDTSGRGSRAPQWLTSLGYGSVQETSVKIEVGYATRIFRCPAHLPDDWEGLFIYGRPPGDKRGGVILPIQGGCWMVTLAGSLRDYPSDDEAGFLEFARSLAQPHLYEAIKDAVPVTPIAVYKYSANRWRHYERMERFPEGFIIMGDAACSFNPVYGQGMAVAAMEAQSLDRWLREQEMFTGNKGQVGFSQLFQQAIARDIKTPWLLSTGEDLRYPGTEGKRSFSIRLLNWYTRRVIELAASDERVAANLLRVRNLLKPLSTLFQPRIILAVLRREIASLRRQPSCDGKASEVSAPVSSSYESLHSKVEERRHLDQKTRRN